MSFCYSLCFLILTVQFHSDNLAESSSSIWASVNNVYHIAEPSQYNKSMIEQCPRIVPPLIPSLFSHVPPAVNFGFAGQIEKDDWLGFWGSPLKIWQYRNLHEYQKFGHFPDTWEVGRKDRLWRNVLQMQQLYGKEDFNFVPLTFVLPRDAVLFKQYWDENPSERKWIIKPHASTRAKGIKVIDELNQVRFFENNIIQRYIDEPYLINGLKFDLRIYVYIASYEPLRIYIHKEGIVRFASVKYSADDLHNQFIHITNYNVNRDNPDFVVSSNFSTESGHKWTLSSLWRHFDRKGINTRRIWKEITDIIVKAILSSENYMYQLVNANVRSHYSCHELYGFDVILDSKLKPWLLEINVSPSMGTSDLPKMDRHVKGIMLRDLFNTAGFHIPKKSSIDQSTDDRAASSSQGQVIVGPQLPSSLLDSSLSTYEKSKRLYYSTNASAEEIHSTILDILTPADIRELVQSEDEYVRRGDFQRAFPCSTCSKYDKYFQDLRYSNLLANTWAAKYRHNPENGWKVLESLCRKQVHLENVDISQNWTMLSTNINVNDHINCCYVL